MRPLKPRPARRRQKARPTPPRRMNSNNGTSQDEGIGLATVRIYKVAELLDTTSQEVLALLKKEHGIELKSASSTVEEVVARSFVERTARQRGITLPGGDMFAEHAAPAKPGAKKGPALKKPAEPPKPAAPVLGPPRLVKTIKPAVPPGEEPHATAVAPPPLVEEA